MSGRAPIQLLAACLALLCASCSGVCRIDFTSPGRGAWQRPEDVIAALDLAPGSQVADLGAGTGYFVPHLLEAVGPDGRVWAVEVEDELTEALAARFAEAPGGAVSVVRGTFDDPRLPDGAVDLVLLVNTYHHIGDRPAYFRRLQGDLSPRGRVAILEDDAELRGVLSLFLSEGHVSASADVEREMREAGYRRVARHEFLPTQLFLVFEPRERLAR